MSDCLFCKIINNEIPANKVYEDEKVLGFVDINPMAKEHYLFIHKVHSENVNEMMGNDPSQAVDILQAIKSFTESNHLVNDGFRVVTNLGKNAGQTVFHTHFHVLGGERLGKFGAP